MFQAKMMPTMISNVEHEALVRGDPAIDRRYIYEALQRLLWIRSEIDLTMALLPKGIYKIAVGIKHRTENALERGTFLYDECARDLKTIIMQRKYVPVKRKYLKEALRQYDAQIREMPEEDFFPMIHLHLLMMDGVIEEIHKIALSLQNEAKREEQ